MAVVALPALATAVLSRRYDEVASLTDLEISALRGHAPTSGHPYSSLLRATLSDFRSMDNIQLHTWAVGLPVSLEEARREGDQLWEWVIVSQLRTIAQRLAGRRPAEVPA